MWIGLVDFLSVFLAPIVADGRIHSNEETPLAIAFAALDVGIQLDERPAEVYSLVERHVRKQFLLPFSRESALRAWNRILSRTERLTATQYMYMRTWLLAESRRQKCFVDFPCARIGSDYAKASTVGNDPQFIEFVRNVRDRLSDTTLAVENRPASTASLRARRDGGIATEALTPPEPQIVPLAVSGLATPAISPAAPASPATVIVEEADGPFPSAVEILALAADLERKAHSVLQEMSHVVSGKPLPGLAFDAFREGPAHGAVLIPAGISQDVWFIGDLHGDLLALEVSLRYIDKKQSGKPYRMVFLGDLFDRGRDGHLVALRILDLINRRPDDVCLIAGNHDVALGYDETAGMFTSSVMPADFADWLNAPGAAFAKQLGSVLIELFSVVPRALLFPDGLLAAHGGIPHSDLWATLTGNASLNDPSCLQDFIWTRAHERRKRRTPNRASKGCEFGYEDFQEFCELTRTVLSVPVDRMIRGHDHVENRYALYAQYIPHTVLTINTMSHRLGDELFGTYERKPSIARWVKGQIPEVHRLNISEDIIRGVYPDPEVTDVSHGR